MGRTWKTSAIGGMHSVLHPLRLDAHNLLPNFGPARVAIAPLSIESAQTTPYVTGRLEFGFLVMAN